MPKLLSILKYCEKYKFPLSHVRKNSLREMRAFAQYCTTHVFHCVYRNIFPHYLHCIYELCCIFIIYAKNIRLDDYIKKKS